MKTAVKTFIDGISNATITVEFPRYKQTEPQNLIQFSQAYLKNIPELMEFLKQKKQTELLLVRIKSDGSILKNEIYGTISNLSLSNKSFTFVSSEDISGSKYEEEIKTFIRTDNVLGIIPLLLGKEINPYKDNFFSSANYFNHLRKMKELLSLCVKTKHTAKLYFRFDEKHPLARNGNLFMEAEILKANKSNVEIKHFRTFAYIDDDNRYVDLFPGKKVELFINPKRYLRKVEVSFGESWNVNPYDDQE